MHASVEKTAQLLCKEEQIQIQLQVQNALKEDLSEVTRWNWDIKGCRDGDVNLGVHFYNAEITKLNL